MNRKIDQNMSEYSRKMPISLSTLEELKSNERVLEDFLESVNEFIPPNVVK